MLDLFQDRLTYIHEHSQNYWMAELGLTQSEQAQFDVTYDLYNDGEGGLVYIHDRSQPTLKQTIYTFEFREPSSVTAFASLLKEEVGYWDAYDYYAGENVDREAASDYERTESAAIKRAWA